MNKLYQNIFLYGLNFSYMLYFLAILGISSLAPQYLSHLRIFLKIYVALLLIYFYNPITYKEKKGVLTQLTSKAESALARVSRSCV